MGRASSSKKVARAARAGGSSGPKQRKLGFPVAIVAIVVLGVSLVVFARNDFTQAAATAPTVGEHWHEAYGVYVCNGFQTPLTDKTETDTTGIHTHGDGIIHIHPFAAGAAGNNATLGTWSKMLNVEFGSDSITLADGTVLKDGFDCGGSTDTTLGVWVWPISDPNAPPTVYTKDFGSIRLENDMAMTIGIVPTGTVPPRPESEGDVAKLDPATDAVVETDPAAATTDSSLTVTSGEPTDTTVPTDPTAALDPSSTTTVPTTAAP